MKIFKTLDHRAFKPIVVIGAILFMPHADAQVVDTTEWVCEFCPFSSGHEADYELGATSVSDDSAFFGNASGYDEAGVYANIDGEGAYASDDHQLRWTVEDLALDSRFAELEGGRQGTFDYNLSYRALPYRRFITTNTIFGQSSADMLALPAGWVRAPLTSGFTQLSTSLTRRDVASDRSFLDIGGRYLPSRRFAVSANYRRQEHDGTRQYGGSYFTQSSLLPGSFDHATDEVDFGIRYNGDSGFVSLAWYLSDFENNNASLSWENPFSVATGAEIGRLAQAPSSRFQQLTLSGRYGFPRYRTVASFSAALGRIEQDEAFLPYTTNQNLVVAPLPRSSLNGEVDTTRIALSLSSKVFNKGRVRLAYRYDERDNQTAQDQWTRVIAETFLTGAAVTNIPYSFKNSTLNLSADYDLFDTLRVSGGYDRKEIDRDFQEVAEQTEDSGWGRLRWHPGATLDIDAKFGASRRDIDQYNSTVSTAFGQNPLMRKYNLAYRYRRFGKLSLTVSPTDSPFAFTLSGMYADDSFSRSDVGITSADDFRLAADASWAVSENSFIYLTGGYENIKSEQSGSETFAAPDWHATNTDDFVTFGGGLKIRQIGDKVDLQLDYTRSDGTSGIDMATAASGQSQFPDLNSTLDFLRLRLSYQRSERFEINMNLRYQRFVADDWALDGVGPATLPTVLTLGAKSYDDDVIIVGIGFRYQIGGAGSAGGSSSD